MERNEYTRRDMFSMTAAGASCLVLPWPAAAAPVSTLDKTKPLRIGMITDVHQDVMHDGEERLAAFIDAMIKEKPDFIMQLGDFCLPVPENRNFLAIWNRFQGPRYHVLGNHDMDGLTGTRDAKREQTMTYWGMPKRYYSFDHGEMHFIVLDGNDPGGKAPGYPRYVAPDQLEWLRKDLAGTTRQTIVFLHQSPERNDDGSVENQEDLRAIFDGANHDADFNKVVACFFGHLHRDYCRRINGIYYPQINSASYHWIDRVHARYSAEIDKAHPFIKYTVPYRDPLWAMVTLAPAQGFLKIEGRNSEFVGPGPAEMGVDPVEFDTPTIQPRISSWRMPT